MSIYGPPPWEPPNPTTQQAREQLEAAARPPVTSRRDRRLHGAACIVAGLCIGVFAVVTEKVEDEEPWATALRFLLIGAALTLAIFRQAARLTPRHTNFRERMAGLVCLPLLIAGVVFLQSMEPDGPSVWQQCLVAAVVALPLVVVGVRILWSSGR